MKQSTHTKRNPRLVFLKCGTCSNAMFHLINSEFNNTKPVEEKASDLLAGGIALRGHQCGMLWGGTLAIGVESFRRYPDPNEATAAAIYASRRLINSFQQRAGTVNCREITKTDWDKKTDFTRFLLKTIAGAFVYSPCFNLFARWASEAIEAAQTVETSITTENPCQSCATEVLKKMGASPEHTAMVTGFAGGIGLSGQTCGALSAVIWYKMLDWTVQHPGKTAPMLNNPIAKKVLTTFSNQTAGETLCHKITGQHFQTPADHTAYLQSDGCRELLEALARV